MDFILRVFGMGTVTKMAHVFGVLTFVAAIQSESNSPWVDIWRITFTLGVGICGTLFGVIWRDMLRRMAEEQRARNQQHRDNQDALRQMTEQQNRIIGAIVAMVIYVRRSSDGGEGDKLIAVLQAILQK
jgi:hypothetical protein